VIDGANNNATATVTVGTDPFAIAVNTVTNQIYVANDITSGTVTVIDGATNTTSTVAVGDVPEAIAVNTVTNQIYVANQNDNTVTVIDGATHATSTVPVGMSPHFIAVNPVTNQIYVANSGFATGTVQVVSAGTVTVIDGATNATTTVPVGTVPGFVAVNPVTNQIYVSNSGGPLSVPGNTVTVIDGSTNATTTVPVGTAPYAIAVNTVTNQIYVTNEMSDNVTVIDGSTNATATVPVGNTPDAIAVNMVTNQIYVANAFSGNVTVIQGQAIPPTIATQPVSQTINSGSTVVFTVGAIGLAQPSLAKPTGPMAMVSPSTTYQWQFGSVNLTDGGGISGSTGPQLVIQGATAADDGNYVCVITVGGVSATSNAANLSVTTSSNPGLATSISTRAFVGTGDNILIGGFFVVGSTSRTVLVQGLGPALGQFGVTGFLAHPTLSIHQTQNGSDVTLYSNTGWGSSQVLLNAAASVFASPTLPANSPDSELLLTLPPGGYSAEVSGSDGGSGVALCAIYELP
jgi:YVTN family beta-propeller protein